MTTPSTSVSASASRELRERLLPSLAVRDQLRDHRVVGERDLVAFLDACVDADTRRQAQTLERPALREERPWILRVQPHLDRVTK